MPCSCTLPSIIDRGEIDPELEDVLVGDESKTYLFLSPFFMYIYGLKVQFNEKLWNFHLDLCFVVI